jgi:hypothetical protein
VASFGIRTLIVKGHGADAVRELAVAIWSR